MSYKIRVILGEQIINHYEETGELDLDLGAVKELEFETEREMSWYLLGLEDAYGWGNYMVESDEFNKLD